MNALDRNAREHQMQTEHWFRPTEDKITWQATSQNNSMVSNLAEQIKSKISLESRNLQDIVVQQICKK